MVTAAELTCSAEDLKLQPGTESVKRRSENWQLAAGNVFFAHLQGGRPPIVAVIPPTTEYPDISGPVYIPPAPSWQQVEYKTYSFFDAPARIGQVTLDHVLGVLPPEVDGYDTAGLVVSITQDFAGLNSLMSRSFRGSCDGNQKALEHADASIGLYKQLADMFVPQYQPK
jgi:hypothetical protein